MLSTNDIKEELSLAYVRAVASRAGFSVEEVRKDRDSVDLRICGRGEPTTGAALQSPELCVQLKATVIDPLPVGEFAFALPTKNYNDLVKTTLVPRILVVFVMPSDDATWLHCSETAMVLRQCAYWVSLLGEPPTQNTQSKTVRLSRRQTFEPASLQMLLERVARQERLP